jgi:hypothetical protein
MSGPGDSYDAIAAADRALYSESGRITAGASAYHSLDPSEIVMRMEEFNPIEHAVSERWALRNEIFSGFVEYVFADGPDPCNVRQRIEGFFESFHPDLAAKITGEKSWVSAETVAAVLRKHSRKLAEVRDSHRSRGSLSRWNEDLEREIDLETVRTMLVELVKLMASEGHDWRRVTSMAYCIAKALRPSIIAGMSLEDIALRSPPPPPLRNIGSSECSTNGCKPPDSRDAASISRNPHPSSKNIEPLSRETPIERPVPGRKREKKPNPDPRKRKNHERSLSRYPTTRPVTFGRILPPFGSPAG